MTEALVWCGVVGPAVFCSSRRLRSLLVQRLAILVGWTWLALFALTLTH